MADGSGTKFRPTQMHNRFSGRPLAFVKAAVSADP
jgi:hypothetical protein